MKYSRLFISTIIGLSLLGSLGCSLLTLMSDSPRNATPVKPAEVISTPAAPAAPDENPTEVAPTDVPTEAPRPNAYYEGISFIYPPEVASSVSASTIEASPKPGSEEPLWMANPTQYEFEFQGYPLSETFHKPKLIVFSVKEFEKMGGEEVTNEIVSLKKLLEARPSESSGTLPFIPFWNAGQVFHTQINYVDFQNGQGIRYLSEYAQYAAPINNEDLFYTFQGITSDGAYYVSAIFPVSHPSLPADPDAGMSLVDPNNTNNQYLDYINGVKSQLNDAAPDSYTPNLSQLDALLASLKIDR